MSAAAAVGGVALLSGAQAATAPGWTTYGGGPERTGSTATSLAPSAVRPSFVVPVRGRVTSQVVAARDVPKPGLTTLYASTSAGRVYALSENGYVRWRTSLGQYSNPDCAQLDGYGVTGTPVVDQAARVLYVADGIGRLHALDLATGREREGWPVALYTDVSKELVWGALTLAGGRVFAATGSYCDAGPFIGKVISVDTTTRSVSAWEAVSAEDGGGGGIWGWGGSAYSVSLDRLFVVTGNAFEGGGNRGPAFSEAAGFGEAIVSLSPTLQVAGTNHPASIDQPLDLDFVGSPVVAARPGCGELVVGMNKNAQVFGWRADDLARGPLWTVDLEQFDPDNPVLSQLAYDPSRSAVFAVTGTQAVRIDIRTDCSAAVGWKRALKTDSLNGSPTVAGGTVWFALSGTPSLVGLDANTGRQVASLPLPGLTVAAPTVLDGRIVVGTFTGQVVAFSTPGAPAAPLGPATPTAPGHGSWVDPRHGWVSREDGVWSTDDGGKHWRRVFARPALTVVRTSLTAGVIRVATIAAPCTCAHDYWTADGGRHWVATSAIQGGLVGRGPRLYWVKGGTDVVQVTPWPPAGRIRSRTIGSVTKGTIVDTALIPDGIAVLARDGVTGDASVLVIDSSGTRTVDLPRAPGALLDQSLSVSGSTLLVDATVLDGGLTQQLRWRSDDRRTWSVDR
ncbi:MAG TPA: PQQ-binding-like beta-propeller repeat protein [Gaiellaceae bacterium]|nr:PQQ-binding-like beta-propeller repeat protein [Gaiellaceae bacterium]